MVSIVVSTSSGHDPFTDYANLPKTLDERVRKYKISKAFEQIPWIYAVVDIVGWSIAGIPLNFFTPTNGTSENALSIPQFNISHRTKARDIRNKVGARNVAIKQAVENEELQLVSKEHPVNRLFSPPKRYEINTFEELKYLTIIAELLQGEYFWTYEKDNDIPINIVVEPGFVIMPISLDGKLEGWKKVDITRGTTVETFTFREILQFKLPNPSNRWRGLPPLRAARLPAEQYFNMSIANANKFSDGTVEPGLVVKTKNPMSPKQEIQFRNKLKRAYGSFKKGQPFIADGDVEDVFSIFDKHELDYLKGINPTKEELATVFHVPPAIVGILEHANYSNIDKQDEFFWVVGNMPRMNLFASTLQLNLLDVFFPDVIAVWDVDSIEALKPDPIVIARSNLLESNTSKNYREQGLSWEEIAVMTGNPKFAELNEGELQPEITEPQPITEEEEEQEEVTIEELGFVMFDKGNGNWEYKISRDQLLQMNENYNRFVLDPFTEEWMKFIQGFLNLMVRNLKSQIRAMEQGGRVTFLHDAEWEAQWVELGRSLMTKLFEVAINRVDIEITRPEEMAGVELWAKQQTLTEILTEEEFGALTKIVNEINAKTGLVDNALIKLNDITLSLINTGATAVEIATALDLQAGLIFKSDALTVARTVTGTVYQEVRQIAKDRLGATHHTWSNSGDNVVRENHQNKPTGDGDREVAIGKLFPITQMRYPLDARHGELADKINCRCTDVVSAVKRGSQVETRWMFDEILAKLVEQRVNSYFLPCEGSHTQILELSQNISDYKTIRRITIKGDKFFTVIQGRNGKGWIDQAYRYPVYNWKLDEARLYTHDEIHKKNLVSFEPAIVNKKELEECNH